MEQGCKEALKTVDETAAQLGIPMEPSKWEGPVSQLTFLGIEVDAAKIELRLPPSEATGAQGGKSAGHRRNWSPWLASCNTVVRPGRSFLRRLYALMAMARRDCKAQ